MPTGYTDIIDSSKEDVELNKFIWRCARAFGSFVMMRDEPTNAKIDVEKLFKVGSYEKDRVKNAKTQLTRIASLNLEECRKQSELEYREGLEARLQSHKESVKLANKYDRMKKLVSEWVPPTLDHESLKKFMLEQLETGYPYVEKRSLPEKPDPQTWHTIALAQARGQLEYAEKSLAEEIARQESRKKWAIELIEDIGEP